MASYLVSGPGRAPLRVLRVAVNRSSSLLENNEKIRPSQGDTQVEQRSCGSDHVDINTRGGFGRSAADSITARECRPDRCRLAWQVPGRTRGRRLRIAAGAPRTNGS